MTECVAFSQSRVPMILSDAKNAVQQMLGSEPYDRFFSQILGQSPLFVQGDGASDRAALLGRSPADTLLDAHATHGATLTCHAHWPLGPPPPPRPVSDPVQFASLVRDYHALGYTVRFPDVAQLSDRLQQMVRSLELVLQKPVEAAVFWSAPGAKAPIHYDEYDIIVIQLHGSKRWFVSTDPPGLNNQWKRPGETPPAMERYQTVTMDRGDFAYLPRGTPHTVESLTESIHLSIGFVPVTLRDAMMAAIDLLSDIDRPLRMGVPTPAAERTDDIAGLTGQVQAAFGRLMGRCDDAFVREAMDLRLSNMVVDLPKLTPNAANATVGPGTRVRHAPLAVAHLTTTPSLVDFAQPGTHILVHRGVEQGLRFIAETREFRIADIPGAIGDDIRIALVQKFLASGFLALP